jgi:endonuclease YncB( thermonuclease family)
MFKFIKALLLLIYFFGSPISGQIIKGKIIYVTDGDTFIFQSDSCKYKIRMLGIDAPEMSQTYGADSRYWLSTYMHKPGTIVLKNIDKYGRHVATLYINNININQLSVRLGKSWYAPQFYKNSAFAYAMDSAKSESKGLWIYSNPIPPWVYRKMRSKLN